LFLGGFYILVFTFTLLAGREYYCFISKSRGKIRALQLSSGAKMVYQKPPPQEIKQAVFRCQTELITNMDGREQNLSSVSRLTDCYTSMAILPGITKVYQLIGFIEFKR
jgi:hypothetical protein